jgi:hypothetical protein
MLVSLIVLPIDNISECKQRIRKKQPGELVFLVFFTNVGYQFFWETPWFVFKPGFRSWTLNYEPRC